MFKLVNGVSSRTVLYTYVWTRTERFTNMPRKQRTRDRLSMEDRDESRGAHPPSPPIQGQSQVQMSEEQLSSFLRVITTSVAESMRSMYESSLSACVGVETPASTVDRDTRLSPTPTSGNFSKCTARFNGTSKDSEVVESFIDNILIYKECMNISDDHALRGLPLLLEGDAAIWWRGIKTSVTSWGESIKRLRGMYGLPNPGHKVLRNIFAREQGDERAEVFIPSVRALLSKLTYAVPVCMEIDIIYGLLHRRIRKRLTRESIETVDNLLEKARAIEDSLAEVCTVKVSTDGGNNSILTSHAAVMVPSKRFIGTSAPASSLRATPSSLTTARPAQPSYAVASPSMKSSGAARPTTRDVVQSASSASSTAPSRSDKTRLTPAIPVDSKLSKFFCFYCRKPGHMRANCDKLKAKPVKCYQCGTPGVTKSNCTMCKDVNVSSVSCMKNLEMLDCNQCNNPNCNNENCDNSNIQYDCKSVSFGSVSAMSVSCNTPLMQYSRPVVNIIILGCQGTALLDTAAKRSIASSSLYTFLKNKGVAFREVNMSIQLADGSVSDRRVLLADVVVDLFGTRVPNTFVIFPNANVTETLLGIDFISKAKLILNFSEMNWATADEPRVIRPLRCENSRPVIHCAAVDVLREDEGTMLSPEQKQVLSNTLLLFDDIFQEGGGLTPFAEHRIDTGDHAPIAVPPYRLTPARKAIMEAEINKMLEEDVIEECESAWAAPALLIPKKDGTFRFCVDYRKLNSITKSDSYPLPVIDDILQNTKKGCYMSTIDLKSGYWQVPVREEDRDKTAFITPFGIHRFKRLPFGLSNGPATFQRLMDRFRSGSTLKDVIIFAYLDDIVIMSDTFDKHIRDLQSVFERLRLFNLRANRAKCVFAKESIKYLGHVINTEGVAPDPNKVSAVLDMKEPTSVKHLQSFLQTCSWFRKFIPNFSQVAQPLTMLLKKNQPWHWSEAQVTAFKELKRLLTTTPILSQPDYSRPFLLRTDASNYALGAVLLQGESAKEEHPIEYASRLLSAAERNYSTTEREALAVVWAVEKFRGYIDGHPVQVISDHQPLKWLFSLKSPSGRLIRWAMKLQNFDLRVDYTPGKANVIADTLSRPVCTQETRDLCGVCSVIVEVPRWDPTTTREAQLADPEVSKIITDLEGADEVAAHRWTERGYHLSKGVLYRYLDDIYTEEPQLVIPVTLRKEVMSECHDSVTSGHGGYEKTLHRVTQRYYFPGMRRYICEYIKTCTECQRYKPSNQKPGGLVQTPVPAQRFEVIAVDLFGPLPKGKNGERWIMVVEDTASRWIELFALQEATAEVCTKVLIGEIFMRYGVPRRIVSDNGVQFVADVMQQAMYTLGVKQCLTPLYHPEANPVERKNRDLKVQLSILVEGHQSDWPDVLSFIRFSMNTAYSQATQRTPAFLTFARELRSPMDARTDLRAIVEAENYVSQVTPYLLKLADTLKETKEVIETQQDRRKLIKDRHRREGDAFEPGDLVLLKTHVLSSTKKGVSSKLMPRRDGPYAIVKRVTPTTYILAFPDNRERTVGKYHLCDLKRYHSREGELPEPVVPKRKRGRPRKQTTVADAT